MPTLLQRRLTREVRVGNLVLGGKNPIRVQSMTSTPTTDEKTTLDQVRSLLDAGCEIVRLAVPNRKAISALSRIVSFCPVPVVADIHFSAELAVLSMEAGVAKVRINPGNLGGEDKLDMVLKAATSHGTAIRIGVNSGSIEKDLMEKYGWPGPEAMVESTMRWIEYCQSRGFDNLVLSLKSSRLDVCVAAYRLISQACDYPLHLGVTEAGLGQYAIIKSAAGMGSLLLDGIGDTIRVSITGDPVQEVGVGFDLLKATAARVLGPELISCPTCGRVQIDLPALASKVETLLAEVSYPLRVAVMGCPVNGPGEAREADIGVAGGNGRGWVFCGGKVIAEVDEVDLISTLSREIHKLVETRKNEEDVQPNKRQPLEGK